MNNAKLDAAEEEGSRGDAEARRVKDLDQITGAIIDASSKLLSVTQPWIEKRCIG